MASDLDFLRKEFNISYELSGPKGTLDEAANYLTDIPSTSVEKLKSLAKRNEINVSPDSSLIDVLTKLHSLAVRQACQQ